LQRKEKVSFKAAILFLQETYEMIQDSIWG
jgi:hypothetical protein